MMSLFIIRNIEQTAHQYLKQILTLGFTAKTNCLAALPVNDFSGF
jgi:hypothetical protein